LHLSLTFDSKGCAHAPPSWEAVQHQEKHLVEVASLEWWGVRIKQGEPGIVLLLEAVGTFG